MKLLLFVAVLAVLICLGVVVATVLAANRRPVPRDDADEEPESGRGTKKF